MIGALDHVIVFVQQLPRATAFYRDVLGLPLLDEIPGFVRFDLGTIWLGLHESESDGQDIGSGPLIYLKVSNVNQVLNELSQKGVSAQLPIRSVPGGVIAVIEDSEGNSIGLYQST